MSTPKVSIVIPCYNAEKWIMQGTFLTDVNFDSLGYSDDGLATISATLRPDRCILVY